MLFVTHTRDGETYNIYANLPWHMLKKEVRMHKATSCRQMSHVRVCGDCTTMVYEVWE